jgi:NADPH:quinone reductase-like Zn-dependent oxidoreductase
MGRKNQAAWLTEAKANPLQVGPAPYTHPGPGELVIQNGAVAINPVDWQKQLLGDIILGYIRYPFILGGDVAGMVVEVGPDVTRFRVGDRVVGAALAIAEAGNNPAEGGFQLYTVLREHMVAPIPNNITYEEACVIPLTLCTAAYGLFHPEFLGLDMPSVPPRAKYAGDGTIRAVIITGGSTSLGSNAIQMAVSAGYEVITTASPRNFDYVRSLGAAHVFDYHVDKETLIKEMLTALEGSQLVGALAIGRGAEVVCAAVLQRHRETTNKLIATASPMPVEEDLLGGAEVRFIDLRDSCEPDGHVARVWKEFLPQALVERQFVPAPPPLIADEGLDKIQVAMNLQMKGVSAQKVVVSL